MASSSSGSLPDDALWPLAIGRVWLLTGGSGANRELGCTESYTVTGFGAFQGRDAFEVTVDWCEVSRAPSTEHYAPGDVDQMFRYVDDGWVVLFQGPVDANESFVVGSQRYQWFYGELPQGFGGGECWRLQIPSSSSSPLLEFCRGLGLVRVIRDELENARDVDVTLTSFTP